MLTSPVRFAQERFAERKRALLQPFNPSASKDMTLEKTRAFIIGRRMTITVEVAISKIFPAGFGWQTAGYFAENAGM